MNPALEKTLTRQNYIRGHALDAPPKSSKPKPMMCPYCCGHGIARAICVVCYTPLCRKHSVMQDGETFCKEHKQGYV